MRFFVLTCAAAAQVVAAGNPAPFPAPAPFIPAPAEGHVRAPAPSPAPGPQNGGNNMFPAPESGPTGRTTTAKGVNKASTTNQILTTTENVGEEVSCMSQFEVLCGEDTGGPDCAKCVMDNCTLQF